MVSRVSPKAEKLTVDGQSFTTTEVKAALQEAILEGDLGAEFKGLLKMGREGLVAALEQPAVQERLGLVADAVVSGKPGAIDEPVVSGKK
jgi:hypothetical protein